MWKTYSKYVVVTASITIMGKLWYDHSLPVIRGEDMAEIQSAIAERSMYAKHTNLDPAPEHVVLTNLPLILQSTLQTAVVERVASLISDGLGDRGIFFIDHREVTNLTSVIMGNPHVNETNNTWELTVPPQYYRYEGTLGNPTNFPLYSLTSDDLRVDSWWSNIVGVATIDDYVYPTNIHAAVITRTRLNQTANILTNLFTTAVFTRSADNGLVQCAGINYNFARGTNTGWVAYDPGVPNPPYPDTPWQLSTGDPYFYYSYSYTKQHNHEGHSIVKKRLKPADDLIVVTNTWAAEYQAVINISRSWIVCTNIVLRYPSVEALATSGLVSRVRLYLGQGSDINLSYGGINATTTVTDAYAEGVSGSWSVPESANDIMLNFSFLPSIGLTVTNYLPDYPVTGGVNTYNPGGYNDVVGDDIPVGYYALVADIHNPTEPISVNFPVGILPEPDIAFNNSKPYAETEVTINKIDMQGYYWYGDPEIEYGEGNPYYTEIVEGRSGSTIIMRNVQADVQSMRTNPWLIVVDWNWEHMNSNRPYVPEVD